MVATISATTGYSAAAPRTALVITINGAINPVTAEFIDDAIASASADSTVEFLLVEMDTPGGLDTSMRQIIKGIQASSRPVVVYVSPSGSRAASAGAFITIAAHVAAMAPSTNIGAASPVNMGGGMDKTMKKKVTNDAAAYIRSVAIAHGKNPDLAEKFVRKGSSVPESEALKKNIIDIVADNREELFKTLDRMTVKTSTGEKTIDASDITIRKMEMNWRQKVFDALANPNIAYILMMLGFYGLIFELSNPGAILPGIIGGICLILAFYSLQALPINFAGILLIILSVIMFLLEIKVPSYGLLTIGGMASLIIGSMMLIDSPEDYLRISIMVIGPTALLTGAFFSILVASALRIMNKKSNTGLEGMVGVVGVAETDITASRAGKVFVQGELWSAVAKGEDIAKNEAIVVLGAEGLTLTVKRNPEQG